MPPRFAYWTILIDGKPTAFRARDRDELLPTLGQLKRKNADVLLRWFARGKLWDSPDAERAAARAPKKFDKRAKDWRPGGEHKDPRQHWRDQKKQRNQERRAERHERKTSGARPHTGSASVSGERHRTGRTRPDDRSAKGSAERRASTDRHARLKGSRYTDRHHVRNHRPDKPREERQPWPQKPPRREERPPKPIESPDAPPASEQIVIKPKPPERG